MREEPVAGEGGHLLERPRLLEEVRGTRHDLEPVRAAELASGRLVELDHRVVAAADDQERGCADTGERRPSEVRAAATRDHGAHRRLRGRRHERGRRPGRGAEQAERNVAHSRLLLRPADRLEQPARQEVDVEHVAAIECLERGQEVEEESREPGLL
jgi:hypothetical protein